MAALLLTVAVDHPSEGVTQRSVAGWRDAIRLLPPLHRAAREMARVPSTQAMPVVAWLRPDSPSMLAQTEAGPVLLRDALLDLPPPA